MSIDIIALIEKNPITKLNGNYQNKLIDKIKKNFTNYEQQLFLSSFYCYLKYDPYTDFVINLDNIWEWLGFTRKYNSKNLLEKNFEINKNYKMFATAATVAKKESEFNNKNYKIFATAATGAKKDLDCDNKIVSTEDIAEKKDTRGGHNKEIFMLNIDTFKKFCLKACTKKADEIHNYFIKLESIMFEITQEQCNELKVEIEQIELNNNNVIEECNELKIQLEQIEIKNQEMEEKLSKQKELEKEQFILKEYATIGSIFYIIKVKTYENGTYIVKIGESRKGIIDRYKQHKINYPECLLLDCFKVDKSKDFESFIKYHEYIRQERITNLPDHLNETELFLIGNKVTYQNLIKIINDNIQKYNYRVSELLTENELLKYKLESQQNNINNELIEDLVKTNNLLLNKVNSMENSIQEILNKLNSTNQQVKINTGFNQQLPTIGPRLQQINPNTSILIKVYDTVTEAMNENKNIKRPSIMKAINENTIYCGYRWLLVERNLDPNIIHNLQPTKKTKVQNIGYIAKLNKEKTEILNVYLDRKTASQLNNYSSDSLLDIPVKKQKISNGYYYILYQHCNDDLIFNFENKYGKPILYKNGIGQYDENNNLLSEFICKYDCIKELKISDKTLNKALKNNVMYNNYYYKELGEKLSVL
jgi:hypothetical protein